MSSVTINSTQVKTLLLNLQQSLNPSTIRAELDKAGDTAVQEAKRLVPVKTGALKNSISSELRGDSTVSIKADKEYATIIEYGGSNRDAKPYLEPGAQRAFVELQKSIESLINGRKTLNI